MGDGLIHIPVSVKQQEFLEAPEQLIVYRGGVRSGKTRVACIKAILNALRGRKQLIMSVDYTQARDVVIATFREILPAFGWEEGKEYKLNLSDYNLVVKGTYIHMRSSERYDKLRGLGVSDVYIDEARDQDSRVYDIVLGRMSEGKNRQIHITSSPNGKDWVEELVGRHKNCRLIIQRTAENPFIDDELIQTLRDQYTDAFAAQELDAKIIEFKGEVIDASTFRMIPPLSVSEGVRFWDLAFADKKKSDWSVGALCLISGTKFTVANIVRVKAKYPDLRAIMIEQALADGIGVKIGIEDVAAQKAVIDDLAREPKLRRFSIIAQRPTGTKMARAMPWVSRAKLGEVQVVQAHWTPAFLNECSMFRADMTHPWDDQIDSVSGAYSCMANVKISSSMRLHL